MENNQLMHELKILGMSKIKITEREKERQATQAAPLGDFKWVSRNSVRHLRGLIRWR
jgi:hypothetical protein